MYECPGSRRGECMIRDLVDHGHRASCMVWTMVVLEHRASRIVQALIKVFRVTTVWDSTYLASDLPSSLAKPSTLKSLNILTN